MEKARQAATRALSLENREQHFRRAIDIQANYVNAHCFATTCLGPQVVWTRQCPRPVGLPCSIAFPPHSDPGGRRLLLSAGLRSCSRGHTRVVLQMGRRKQPGTPLLLLELFVHAGPSDLPSFETCY